MNIIVEKSKDLVCMLGGTIEPSRNITLSSQRCNRMRPSPEMAMKRVSEENYPDAIHFGRSFTGSVEAAEFFEKVVNGPMIKLHWCFTTAMIKTSLNHLRQGHTQLFGGRVDPETYLNVLLNPRVHTGKRYQRKKRG